MLYAQVTEIEESILGGDHPAHATTLSNRARSLVVQVKKI